MSGNTLETQTFLPSVKGADLDLLIEVPNHPRALIIDDDLDTLFIIKETLRNEGYDVCGALNCDQALSKCRKMNPEVILLDLMMPGIDGWDIFEYLRRETEAPIIILSAMGDKEKIIRGLSMGAEDYLTKPFDKNELILRIGKTLRRSKRVFSEKILSFPKCSLEINTGLKLVHYLDRDICLTSKEYALLEFLASCAPNPVRYGDIAWKLWNEECTPNIRNSIRCLIHFVRRKLEVDPLHPQLIVNYKRVGYQLRAE